MEEYTNDLNYTVALKVATILIESGVAESKSDADNICKIAIEILEMRNRIKV